MEFLADLWGSLFGGDKPTPGNVRRAIKAATEPHGEAGPRVNAALRLAEWGTPEAIQGLLKRFTVQTPSGAVDQEEKQHVRDLLIDIGKPAVAPILTYLEAGEEASYPVQALESILGNEELIDRVTEVLGRLDGAYTRTPKGKVGLIDVLASHDDANIPEAVLPFLDDPDDDVTFAAINCLAKPVFEPKAREPFLELLVNADDRPRIQTHILDTMSEQKWTVSGYRPKVEALLPEGYFLTSKGFIHSKAEL